MGQLLDTFDIDKILFRLKIRSFKLRIDDADIIFLRRYSGFWKDTGFLKKINRNEFFNSLRLKVIRLKKEKNCDLKSLENKIEMKLYSQLNKTEFRIYRFVRCFNRTPKKDIFNIIKELNNDNFIYTSDDRNCGLVLYKNAQNMFDTLIDVRLPRKFSNLNDVWYPEEKKAREILEFHDKVGFNSKKLRISHEILNCCAQGYINKTTHLLLRKNDLVIIISARNKTA